jgi:LuxR family maltose regulon positive regulatory protein
MLHTASQPPLTSILTTLINEITTVPNDLVLVLDDYHVIEAQPIHEALIFLLDHLPPQMHLVIASRTDPPLPLSRLRTRGQLTELRTADLRFTLNEATTLLNQVMGLKLTVEDVAALEIRTEGWVAGLQLAALAMQSPQGSLAPQRQTPEHVTSFIASLSGSHRYILDYLVEEVLYQQPPDVQGFLLQTAILDRLTAPLCDAVTGRSDSQAMLEHLDAANLFVVPLDDARRWYRYHRLFADLLRSRLSQTQPDQVSTLHHQASNWYEQRGLIAEAVSHALAANDVERVARLVEGNALAMLDHGELTTLVGWLDTLPDDVVRARPWLCVAHAWALAYAGQLDAVESLLQDAEKTMGEVAQHVGGLRVTGHIAAIRAYAAVLGGNSSHAVELARKALDCLPAGDLTARSFAATQLAYALRASGDLKAATQAMSEASRISQAVGNSHVAIMALCYLAGLQGTQGQLGQAAATYRVALQLADECVRQNGRQLPVAGYVYTRMSMILLEWNDLEAATHYAATGLELCQQWGWTELLVDSYVFLARVLQAVGDTEGALHAIQRARQAARDVSAWYVAEVEICEVRIRLAQGDVAAAFRWAQTSGLSAGDEFGFQDGFRYRTLARILIAQASSPGADRSDKVEKALGLLTRLLEVEESAGAMLYVVEILVLQALALQAQGEGDRALTTLARALTLAEPEGYVRTFIDEGMPMDALLRQAVARGVVRGTTVEYAGQLLAASKREMQPPHRRRETTAIPGPASSDPLQRSGPPIEPLSQRELEVLHLLAAGLSNREIAQTLFIVVGTVKNHLKNIYRKLDVHNRTDAVARARDLGLL